MRNRFGAAIAGAAVLMTAAWPTGAAAQTCPCPPDAVHASELHAFRLRTVAEGLEHPWSIAFLPGGDILVTEKPGRLRIVRDGVLRPEPVRGTPAVRFQGQGGLLEVAPHPDFATNRILYLSYSKPSEDGARSTTALARARFDGDRLTDVEDIFVADAWGAGGAHFGGKIAFDPDGYLYLTVGDRGANPLAGPRAAHPAQDLSNHQGTIVRLHDDGRVPADNPFVGRAGARPEIWSWGHRNPQGLVIDAATGAIWSTEHGPQGGDELNLVLRGRNYGWPVIGYGVQYGGAPIHEARERDGMEQPVQFWTPSIAVSGLMLYTGDRFPAWRGHLFAGGLDGRRIERLVIAATDHGPVVQRLERPGLLVGFGRVRDVREGPDGLVYVVFDDRRAGGTTALVRLEPADP
jgi:glucose/arabinose dehydrogenase